MINVLHVGHSRKWRGGENQVRLLIEGMTDYDLDIEHHIAYPKNAIAFQRLKHVVNKNKLELPSTRAFDLRSVFAIVDYVRQHKINIIDAHSGNAHTLAFYAALFLPKAKLVVHRRVDNRIKKSFLTRKKYRSNRVDRWIAISEKIASILIDYGVEADKVNIIKSSIKKNQIPKGNKTAAKKALCSNLALNEQFPLIGFAGAMSGQKNPMLFVEIIKKLIESGIQVNAVMAGSGDLASQVNSRIEELNLTNHLKLLGFITNIDDYFASLDMFVLPSVNEGLGTVLLEAVNARCSIIASNVGGIGEIIIDNKTGRLVDNQSVRDFSNAIQFYLNQPQAALTIQDNALAHVKENFSYDSMISKTAALYHDLMQ